MSSVLGTSAKSARNNKEAAMMIRTVPRTFGLLGLALALAAPDAALAQVWPTRNIRAIIPLAPGNAQDVVGRIVLEQLSRQIGQPIVVENRAGAGGTTGAAVVAKAAADGHTVLVHYSSFSAGYAI